MNAKAKESSQVNRARKKIKHQLEVADKRLNAEALKKTAEIIHNQLKRRSSAWKNLKQRQIILFDENSHSASPKSAFVNKMLETLKKNRTRDQETLEGRIKAFHE